ncbi:hypothetical protein QCA50_007568 [Cerrena zonata]|uniref:Cytochrome P450 n=1 Tax=Cerrena zonata TaxID=2478898 RepID=A0AAW0GBD8_9APHY
MSSTITQLLPSPTLNGLTLALISVVTYILYVRYVHNRLCRYQPGPRPLPFFGNILQLPMEYQERRMMEWGKTFGDIIYARFFSTHTIVINSPKVAHELLEKRSANYSDRPPMVLHSEIMGHGKMLTHTRYGDRLRKLRKWTHDAFMLKAALKTYEDIQTRETYILLAGLIESPDEFVSHFTRFTAATVAEIAYGLTVRSLDDEYIHLADRTASETVEAGSAGSMLVDFFPILKHYPLWLPGSGWKRNALRIRDLAKAMNDVPFNRVKDDMEKGVARHSFVSGLLEKFEANGNLTEEDEDDIKCAAGVLYGAGTETTANVFTAFLLAMTMFPRVFRKAQAEIDRVIGSDRLPGFNDRDSLPYLECIIREVYRWHPPTPLGIPHYSMKDDEYRGRIIPANSLMIANIWGMTRDPDNFPDAEDFYPERFDTPEWTSKSQPDSALPHDPRNLVFGFGRRQCPARNFADSNVFLVLAHLIATMDISKAQDERGIDIHPEHVCKSGFVHHILPFRCSIRPRSPQTARLIMQLRSAYESDSSVPNA